MLKNTKEDKVYASILSDGLIHVPSFEGADDAVKRTYETSDGKTGEKWEKRYTEIGGVISKMSFRDGDYGSQLVVEIVDGDEKPILLTLSTSSNYFEDFAKKIFNVKMDEFVLLQPYSFVDEKGKSKKGITIKQNGIKIENYFYDKDNKKNKNDYPESPKPKKGKDSVSKDEWKLWFGQCRIFLIDKMTEHFKLDEPTVEEVTADDIPF